MSVAAYHHQVKKWLELLYPKDSSLRAKKLLCMATGRAEHELYLLNQLTRDQIQKLMQLTQDHLRGISLQHLESSCFVLEFEGVLARNSLAPREETIFLIDHLAKMAANRFKNQPILRVLELGCASSLMLCAFVLRLFHYGFRNQVELYASDIDPELIAASECNKEKLFSQLHKVGLRDYLSLFELRIGPWWDPWKQSTTSCEGKTFDLVYSNPPYISKEDASRVDTAVWLSEPHLALFAEGKQGLGCYTEIMQGSRNFLNQEKGVLAFEMGDRQAGALRKWWTSCALQPAAAEIVSDMEGIDRFLLLYMSTCETEPLGS